MSTNGNAPALAPSTRDAVDAGQRRARWSWRWLPVLLLALAWGALVGNLAFFVGWIFTDARVAHAIDVDLGRQSWEKVSQDAATMHWRGVRVFGLAALVAAGVILVGLFVGPRWHRTLRVWLGFLTVVAVWLALIAARHDLAWLGQELRVDRLIAEFEPVALSLRRDWPIADDVTEELGPFSAYPNGRPRILMPLLKPSARGNHAPFSVIERSPEGALRFELVGHDAGAWLEWHPGNSRPASFVGGLETEYELLRASRLAEGWYLTRYQARGLASL
jgi:hypothetical protein